MMAPLKYLAPLELCSRLNTHQTPTPSGLALSPLHPQPQTQSLICLEQRAPLLTHTSAATLPSPMFPKSEARPGYGGVGWEEGGWTARGAESRDDGGEKAQTGYWRSRDVLALNRRECNPKETSRGCLAERGRGALGGCRLAEETRACGLLSQAVVGPLVASWEMMPGCPRVGGGRSEQLVLWGWGRRVSA